MPTHEVPRGDRLMSDHLEPAPGDALLIEARYGDTEATIALDGEFDMSGVARFSSCVSAVLAPHPLSVAVDARGVTFIDSSGLMALLRGRDVAAEAGVAFRVVKPSPPLRRLAELTGVEDLLPDE
jgi:anti-sigma B factor antagonist